MFMFSNGCQKVFTDVSLVQWKTSKIEDKV